MNEGPPVDGTDTPLANEVGGCGWFVTASGAILTNWLYYGDDSLDVLRSTDNEQHG